MKLRVGFCSLTFLVFTWLAPISPLRAAERLPTSVPELSTWWAPSSAAKIQPDTPPPATSGKKISLQCARNEWESAQLVIRSSRELSALEILPHLSHRLDRTAFPGKLELLQAKHLNLTRSSDQSSKPGLWPDPLLPVEAPVHLGPNSNHVFWIRVHVPKDAQSGVYEGVLRIRGQGVATEIPLELFVYDFTLPDRMTCTTAFGFSPGEVFRYHGLKTESEKREVLDKYLANLAAHHISPYDPAPLNPIKVTWPEVRPPRTVWDNWTGLRFVSNEVHSGQSALLIYDDQPGNNVSVTYEPLIPIPKPGFRLRGWFRTAVPGHRFILTFNHHDAQRAWMSGRNNDLSFSGTGQWQPIDEWITNAPPDAAFVRFHARATLWTDSGDKIGLVWLDDLSLTDLATGTESLPGGDFERPPRTKLTVPAESLRVKLDFTAWDKAMERAMNHYHFNSFQVHFPGLGGGTFHAIDAPNLLGFQETDPEYPLLMSSYGTQLEAHLRQRGWLDRAFVYWFDEPSPDQYPFVMNGFAKLKRYAPGLTRMLTEQVEPGLIGGPNLWCPISNEYNPQQAPARRAAGDKFWWYVCTGPKAPYAGLFIDHPAPEMRIWGWQTWQRQIDGLLVWQINYWNSTAAYPDRTRPQNPYEDPMSWTSGYSTPAGERLPWGNGDGRFIYPPLAAAYGSPSSPVLEGPIDSIRWEQLRDGIEDYEYFCILRERLRQARTSSPASSPQKPGPAELDALEELLQVPAAVTRSMTEFTADGSPIESHRAALAAAIQKLQP